MDKTILASVLKAITARVPDVIPLLAPETLQALKAADGYDGVRTVMRGDIWGAIFGYLSGGSLADARSRMATGVAKGYIETSDIAYQDGGSDLPIDEETAAWARGQLDAQLGFVDALFDTLKDLRKAGDFDAGEVANARADGYCASLDSFYGEMKMRGSENITLEFGGDSGKESCGTCSSLMGKRHKIKYILDNNGNNILTTTNHSFF